MKRFLIIVLIFTFGALETLAAVPSAPSRKPSQQMVSNVIPSRERLKLNDGLEAADAGAWSRVRSIRRQLNDDAAADLLLWKIAANNSSSASFDELSLAMERLSGWPYSDRIRRYAETALAESSLSSSRRRDWLNTHPPITGTGKLENARLLRASGKTGAADALIREVWRDHSLSSDESKETLARHSRILSQADHVHRVKMLLWSGQRSQVKRLLSRLPNADRKVAEAQLAMMERRRGVDTLIRAVPSSHANDPGLLYERARWRRKRARNMDGAIEILLKLDAEQAILSGRDNIWKERRIVLRTLIKERKWRDAYAISANHGLTKGVDFAEAEFNAGWIALRFLDEAQLALAHFESLANGVGAPISLSRAHYWRGRALERLNRNDQALAAYTQANEHIFTFYGQLAAEKLKAAGRTQAVIAFEDVPLPSDEEQRAFESRPMVRAASMLAEMGYQRDFERFLYALDDELQTPQELQMLYNVALKYLSSRPGVRAGKTGLGKGIIAPDAAYPIVDLPPSPLNGAAEDALVIALSRQESELETTARSRANARGLMQLLPGTGRQTARQIGERYRTSWLIDDPTYNMRLGRAYLDSMVSRFNGSYVLALTSYNAGPHRSTRWIEDYGDPRSSRVDTIDWIESIPFSETRNYVMRVMENVQVYRHRLSGQPEAIRLTTDINRGRPD